MKTYTLLDVRVYKTLSNEFRAYIKGEANLQAWGFNKERAVDKLAQFLASKSLPFDFS